VIIAIFIIYFTPLIYPKNQDIRGHQFNPLLHEMNIYSYNEEEINRKRGGVLLRYHVFI